MLLWEIGLPARTPAISSTTPIMDASVTLPGLIRYIHWPIRKAIGIVQAMVNTPQALSESALTTTIASPASATIMMNRTANAVHQPAVGPR